MPIQKFKSLEEARRAQRSIPGSETNLRRLRFVLEFWSRVRPKAHTRGVTKFRSMEEADATAVERDEPRSEQTGNPVSA